MDPLYSFVHAVRLYSAWVAWSIKNFVYELPNITRCYSMHSCFLLIVFFRCYAPFVLSSFPSIGYGISYICRSHLMSVCHIVPLLRLLCDDECIPSSIYYICVAICPNVKNNIVRSAHLRIKISIHCDYPNELSFITSGNCVPQMCWIRSIILIHFLNAKCIEFYCKVRKVTRVRTSERTKNIRLIDDGIFPTCI